MPQALVSGSVALQQNSSVLPVPLVASKGPYTFLRCTTRRLKSRQCRTCGAYQQEVEETIRRKAPSTPPGPDTTRRPPPPPPPPPPPSGQVEPDAVAELVFLTLHRQLHTIWYLQFSGQTRRTILALFGICSVAYGYNITQHPDAPPDAPPGTETST